MTKVSPEKATKPEAAKKAKAPASSRTKRGGGGGGPQRILDICLTLERRSHGDVNVPRRTVLALSGVKNSTFPVAISGMKKKGLIDYDKDFIRLTDDGRAKANPGELPEISVDNETVQADIKKRHKLLGGNRGLLYDLLLDGRAHGRAAAAERIGCTNKATFAVALSNMKKDGIITYDKDTVSLTDMCFPKGRPTYHTEC